MLPPILSVAGKLEQQVHVDMHAPWTFRHILVNPILQFHFFMFFPEKGSVVQIFFNLYSHIYVRLGARLHVAA